MLIKFTLPFAVLLFLTGCSKNEGGNLVSPTPPATFQFKSSQVNGASAASYTNINLTPVVRYTFSGSINGGSIAANVLVNEANGVAVAFQTSLENNDSTLVIRPTGLKGLTRYNITVASNLQSKQNINLGTAANLSFQTGLDSSRKFPSITDEALLTLVQQQTFKYFWEFGHPTSGLARERTGGDDQLVTSGGSGFGIMTIPVGISRNFISRAEGLARLQTIVGFLKNRAQTFHGAFPHWLNGSSGVVIPFSTKDNGADLVETSFLMQGLLTARQYFNGSGAEATLRTDIDTIWRRVEWNWFRKGSENVLYWHWSPNYNWDINLQIRGWNECLITYVLAASSPTYPISKAVYESGFARNGAMANGNTYFGVQLPLGEARGGPLFFSHYSFLGLDPNGLTDAYATYFTQNRSHALINHNYCVANPAGQPGYSDSLWGLTASDIPNGYSASSPNNDLGVIAPTAALASFPYTPTESMKALKFFYYVLGDRLWKEYGFIDAFSIKDVWFASSFLAIDQGPIIVMIENHRSKMLWKLFTDAPEVKTGLRSLGFSAPYL